MTFDERLFELLASSEDLQWPSNKYRKADLSGAKLSGLHLACFSLRGVNLEGADLSGARLMQVDLVGASLKGANLEGAYFQLVNANNANLASTHCKDAFWEQTDLTGADLSGADLRMAMIRGCNLEKAKLDDADLDRASLLYSNCCDASFQRANFMWGNTVGSSFARAEFADAKQFFLCQEILREILRREIKDDFEAAKLVGAIAVFPQWCYPHWKKYLKSHPEYRYRAFEAMRRYPESGFIQALHQGWRPPGEERTAADNRQLEASQ